MLYHKELWTNEYTYFFLHNIIIYFCHTSPFLHVHLHYAWVQARAEFVLSLTIRYGMHYKNNIKSLIKMWHLHVMQFTVFPPSSVLCTLIFVLIYGHNWECPRTMLVTTYNMTIITSFIFIYPPLSASMRMARPASIRIVRLPNISK